MLVRTASINKTTLFFQHQILLFEMATLLAHPQLPQIQCWLSGHFTVSGTPTKVSLSKQSLTLAQSQNTRSIPVTFASKFHYRPSSSLITIMPDPQNSVDLANADSSIIAVWNKHLSQCMHRVGFYEDYQPLRKIGTGVTAGVYLALDLHSHVEVAVKAFPKIQLAKDPHGYAALRNQLAISRMVDSPRITRIIASYETQKSFYLVYKLAPGQMLQQYLSTHNGSLHISVTRSIIKQIAEGIRYLSELGISHRDLKPENILYDQDSGSVCIVDLGFATFHRHSNHLYPFSGTAGYVAPERFSKHNPIVTETSDVFALGVIMHFLLFHRLPYRSIKLAEIFHCNRKGKFHFDCRILENTIQHDLISKMLSHHRKRINIQSVLSHQFFSSPIDCQKSCNPYLQSEDNIRARQSLILSPLQFAPENDAETAASPMNQARKWLAPISKTASANISWDMLNYRRGALTLRTLRSISVNANRGKI